MKRYTVILLAAATLFSAVSCTRETEYAQDEGTAGYELLFKADVGGMATRTTVPDESALMEDAVNTLDVFISGTFKGDSEPSVKGYHLTTNDKVGDSWRIARDWRQEKLDPGQSYTLYVAANSAKVRSVDPAAESVATVTLSAMAEDITTLGELGNVIEFDYDPDAHNYTEEGLDDTGNMPFWGSNNDDGVNPAWLGIHKKYTSSNADEIAAAGSKADRYFTHDKSFLMNGTSAPFVVPSNPNTADITVPSVTLSRAAAKIRVYVEFDPSFLAQLARDKHWSLHCGEPHWRFYNFAFSAPVFSDLSLTGNYNPKESWFTSGADLIGFNTINGNDLKYGDGSNKSFSFSTYSYPLTWTEETASEEAPAIIISVGYQDDTDLTSEPDDRPVIFQSYKIPVVDPDGSILSLDRNHIYTINATISSEGSTLVTDAYEIKAAYSIKNWEEPDTGSPVSWRDNSYIDVVPDAITETTDVTDVILRGNGEQTVRLHVLKPDTKDYRIAYYGTAGVSYDAPFNNQTSSLTAYPLTGNYTDAKGKTYSGCAASGAAVPYYLNKNGTVCNTISSSSLQNCFVKDGDDLLIISEALPNKAVKYMKIRVYLDGYAMDAPGKYMDVNIRHYPTDFISAYKGVWSSRHSARLVAPSPYTISSGDVVHGPEDYTITETEVTHQAYDSFTGYKRWEWVTCSKSTYDNTPAEDRYWDTEIIPQNTFMSHANNTLDQANADEGYEKHVSTYGTGTDGQIGGSFGYYFYKNNGSTNNTPAGHTVAGSRSIAESARSEADAFESAKQDENRLVYYWGEGDPVQYKSVSKGNEKEFNNYDYYTVGPYYSYAYRYPTRKRVYYTGPVYHRKAFYTTSSELSSGPIPRWVNWDNDLGEASYETVSGSRLYFHGARYWDSDYATRYCAKIISGDTWYIYYGYQSGGTRPSTVTGTSESSSKNPYMYVLQISETSAKYTVGRPVIDNATKLSGDDVLSPAFMIASQLAYEMEGFATPSPSYAALHCASYLEVGTDGTYYSGWRLPTKSEIETMIKYQGNSSGVATLVPGVPVSSNDRAMEPVLTAAYYVALDGSWIKTNYNTSGTQAHTIRCVRDLTPEEIEALNN